MIALIVAYTRNRLIGNKGRIPWNLSGEQVRFKELTTGNIVIMGRKTYEEIGHPLPHRFTIVVSTTKNISATNCVTVGSFEEAIARARQYGGDIFIAGGARLYELALPLCEKLYVTKIDAIIEGDCYFPKFDTTQYTKTFEKTVHAELDYQYVTYTKKR
ncbi:MAG TPA: dihydrofolate reductase [Treponemataceae bacterium]|nr:dihydrofolate reductase [Treponemataceae bacterium]